MAAVQKLNALGHGLRLGGMGARAAIALLVLASAALLLMHQGRLVNYLYPFSSLLLAAWLFRRHPTLYLVFAWWIWFLTPEVRRLVDYQIGWQTISPVMLTPFLVSGLAFLTVLVHAPKLRYRRLFPLALAFLGVGYGYLVGFAKVGAFAATYGLLSWATPIAFAFHLAVHWRQYPENQRAIYRAFAWGVLVMGTYGLLQFIHPPAWDRFWMVSVQMNTIGHPVPFGVRVFSTMNSPGPFAVEIMAGLILLFATSGALRLPAAIVGYTAFLLSLVRGAWGGWVVGMAYLLLRSRPKHLVRVAASGVAVLLLAYPLMSFEPIRQKIDQRFDSIQNLEQNQSYQARKAFYDQFADTAYTTIVGQGLGSTGMATKLENNGQLGQYAHFDSGLMNIPFVLGWPGALLYVIGSSWLLLRILRSHWTRLDPAAAAGAAVALGVFVQLPFVNVLTGESGMIFWAMAGLLLAGIRYSEDNYEDSHRNAQSHAG